MSKLTERGTAIDVENFSRIAACQRIDFAPLAPCLDTVGGSERHA
ncbi:MAG TPA: hypothetical protein VJN18_10050 [Polyangiaceae bacterium]|nr:hypothetical protein [Polyangiaceae bacterium]